MSSSSPRRGPSTGTMSSLRRDGIMIKDRPDASCFPPGERVIGREHMLVSVRTSSEITYKNTFLPVRISIDNSETAAFVYSATAPTRRVKSNGFALFRESQKLLLFPLVATTSAAKRELKGTRSGGDIIIDVICIALGQGQVAIEIVIDPDPSGIDGALVVPVCHSASNPTTIHNARHDIDT